LYAEGRVGTLLARLIRFGTGSGARLDAAREDLRLARSRVDELRGALPEAWDVLKPSGLCSVSALKNGDLALDPRLGSMSADPAACPQPAAPADPA
jgi:hypothetical protein